MDPSSPGIAGLNIGAATALRLAQHGAAVCVVDLTGDAVEQTRCLIQRHGGSCIVCVADIAREEDCLKVAAMCADQLGPASILQNNAAVGGQYLGGILAQPPSAWQRTLDVNVHGMLNMIRAVLPEMRTCGGGVITNVSSVASLLLHQWPDLALYNLSKSMVNTLTRQLAREFAPLKIRVNALLPGIIDTPANRTIAAARDAGKAQQVLTDRGSAVPMGWVGSPDDVAAVSAFLASSDARYITGQVLAVDGGMSA
jgi:NAD(P)-dependent dehydrogenase (short-subunit alcohol dehydrogenase family)